ncbi:MAG: GNAT family N-acetyltransferase [Deltaproteobacteria bacterium]|nr:GNAT family N-acetyltransferase [Deltaproteobacteria bacterium]
MIRAYREADWNQVSAIYDLAKPDEMKGFVDAQAITPLAQDGPMLRYFSDSELWVYEENGYVHGFIGLKKDVVSWLFVHPDHRRKGIARSLLNELINIHQGSLRLNIAKSNQPAMTLYESFGFEAFEEFEGNMYGCPIPAVRMRL